MVIQVQNSGRQDLGGYYVELTYYGRIPYVHNWMGYPAFQLHTGTQLNRRQEMFLLYYQTSLGVDNGWVILDQREYKAHRVQAYIRTNGGSDDPCERYTGNCWYVGSKKRPGMILRKVEL